MVYFRNGTTGWVELRLKTFIKRIAAPFAVDIKESRRRFGSIVGQKNLVPLILAPLFVYVPIKTRVPRVSGDSAYGYFRLRSILEVKPDPLPTTIRVEGGQEITVQQALRTVHNRLRTSQKLEAHLFEEYCLIMSGREAAFAYNEHYNLSPASARLSFEQGLIRMPGTRDTSTAGVENLMEKLVFEQLRTTLATEKLKLCQCEDCFQEMAVAALNKLAPCYVLDAEYKGNSQLEHGKAQCHLEVTEAVKQAIEEVGNRHRHNVKI